MNELINQILDAAKNEPKSIDHLLLKLMEEVGESSQAYLSSIHSSGSNYKNLSIDNFREELIDILLVTITLLHKTDIDRKQFIDLINTKIEKWQSKQGN